MRIAAAAPIHAFFSKVAHFGFGEIGRGTQFVTRVREAAITVNASLKLGAHFGLIQAGAGTYVFFGVREFTEVSSITLANFKFGAHGRLEKLLLEFCFQGLTSRRVDRFCKLNHFSFGSCLIRIGKANISNWKKYIYLYILY